MAAPGTKNHSRLGKRCASRGTDAQRGGDAASSFLTPSPRPAKGGPGDGAGLRAHIFQVAISGHEDGAVLRSNLVESALPRDSEEPGRRGVTGDSLAVGQREEATSQGCRAPSEACRAAPSAPPAPRGVDVGRVGRLGGFKMGGFSARGVPPVALSRALDAKRVVSAPRVGESDAAPVRRE